MISALNFAIAVIWSVVKLLIGVMMLCITFLVTRPLVKEVATIFADMWKDILEAWEEVEEMERQEYGE